MFFIDLARLAFLLIAFFIGENKSAFLNIGELLLSIPTVKDQPPRAPESIHDQALPSRVRMLCREAIMRQSRIESYPVGPWHGQYPVASEGGIEIPEIGTKDGRTIYHHCEWQSIKGRHLLGDAVEAMSGGRFEIDVRRLRRVAWYLIAHDLLIPHPGSIHQIAALRHEVAYGREIIRTEGIGAV